MFDLPPPARAVLCALALASAPVCAAPDRPHAAPRPDEAAAAVPETRYRAPAAYRPAEAPATTPDRHWVEANRTVLGYKPMMLTMPPRPAKPPAGPEEAAPPPSPAHQHGHAGKGHH